MLRVGGVLRRMVDLWRRRRLPAVVVVLIVRHVIHVAS
jgi:hypothetical protein